VTEQIGLAALSALVERQRLQIADLFATQGAWMGDWRAALRDFALQHRQRLQALGRATQRGASPDPH
jgi:hypothetical protein